MFLSGPFLLDKWILWEDFLEKEVINPEIRFRFLIFSFLMAFTGVRISEARLMTCRQLKTLLERGSARIFHVKRLKREGRIITLPAVHRKKLRELSPSSFGGTIGTDIASERDWPLFPGITQRNSISR